MSTPDTPVEQVRLDDDATPRPEEEVADAGPAEDVPAVAGGADDGEPAQGSGAADSW